MSDLCKKRAQSVADGHLLGLKDKAASANGLALETALREGMPEDGLAVMRQLQREIMALP